MSNLEKKLAIAIQKPTGKTNLGDETAALLQAGSLKWKLPNRVDDGPTNIEGLDIILMRNGDITRAVAEGEADLGVVGLDKYGEYSYGTPPLVLKELGFSFCSLKLGVRNDIPYLQPESLAGLTIATSYPIGTRRFFGSFGIDVNIRKYDGGAETAVKRGWAQACIEASDTGMSMIVNNIRPVADVLSSQAVLIANPDLPNIRGSQAIVWRTLRAVMTGVWNTQYRVLKFDFPENQEREIMNDIPTRESPTKMPLEKEGWSAAETLIPKASENETIERLLLLGARAIFINPIERLIPDLDDPETTRMMKIIYGESWRLPIPPFAIS